MEERADTIAAVSTAAGEAGIAIVRISGPESLKIADAVFRCGGAAPSCRPEGTFVHGYIRPAAADAASDGAADADEVILLIYRCPHSYTREDVVEIQGHGGRRCAGRILRCVLDAGARLAEPGEFTRRAFLNGRIDLLQAEAVLDLIRARSERAASAALQQLEGRLSSVFAATYNSLLEAAADLEATLDFPEEDFPGDVIPSVKQRIVDAVPVLERLLATWEEGHVLREGALVVIAGRPNVGKSTLLNRLLGKERAIVAETPGTTRDTIEEQIILRGIPLRLVDTAGMRESECGIEREGVERARASLRTADLILYVIDASAPLDRGARLEIESLNAATTLIVRNKIDLPQQTGPSDLQGYRVFPCSLLKGIGLENLLEGIVSAVGVDTEALPHPVISERHRIEVQYVLTTLNSALLQMEPIYDEHFIVTVASDLRSALERLGRITGRIYSDDLLDAIFSRFCIGK